MFRYIELLLRRGPQALKQTIAASSYMSHIELFCRMVTTSRRRQSFEVAHSVSKLVRSLAGSPEIDEEVAFGN